MLPAAMRRWFELMTGEPMPPNALAIARGEAE
jgi:hypothetical protein